MGEAETVGLPSLGLPVSWDVAYCPRVVALRRLFDGRVFNWLTDDMPLPFLDTCLIEARDRARRELLPLLIRASSSSSSSLSSMLLLRLSRPVVRGISSTFSV